VDQRHGGRHHDHAEECSLGGKHGARFVLKVIVADRANGGMARTVTASAAARHRRDLKVLVDVWHAQGGTLVQLDCRFHILGGSSGMRRWADLDSNSWVAARPYCNGRATAFDKVLTY